MAGYFILGLIAVLVVIVLIPTDLPHVTLISLNVSKLNSTSYRIMSGYVDMQFQVRNTNFFEDFCYDDMYCSLFHGERLVASTMYPGFFQGVRETKTINFTVYLTPVTNTSEIRKDLAPYSLKEFDVKLDTFISSSWSTKSFRVTCNEVPVGLVLTARGHGKMIGPARKCKVF